MNILWLSWKDIKNPDAGGAERVAIEIASRLVSDKNRVTIFTSRFKNSKPQEVIRGAKIIRKGNRLTCRIYSFFHYMQFNKTYDIIIDEINTIPFFSTLYAKDKTIALIHQLAREYWFKHTVFPINIIGYLAEPIWLKLYKNSPTLALGNSTKRDLEKIGFTKIKTYRPGINFKLPKPVNKKQDYILFLGRLTEAKNPKDAILAFQKINNQFPHTKLFIVGRGKRDYLKKLRNLARSHKIQKSIKFKGFVTEKEKINLLKKSKIILIPSIREGWGLVVIEANAASCIPVAYNVPGLKDAIEDNKTGILTKNNPNSLALAAVSLLKDERLRNKLAQNCYKFSKQFSWERTYKEFRRIVIIPKMH